MRSNKPKIGITLSQSKEVTNRRWPMRKGFDYLKREYHNAIISSGGIPILFPNITDKKMIKEYVSSVDGLLLTGGNDMNPERTRQKQHYKSIIDPKQRDMLEFTAVEFAIKLKLPILGICRGHQVLNVALGGDIYQDLACMPVKTLNHKDPGESGRSFHKVKINKDSKLYGIIKKANIEVNSSHHQAIARIGDGLKAVGFAPDGVIEVLENPEYPFMISVQWHPESISKRDHSIALFKSFVKSCVKR